jgi:hypothetical protein
VEDYSHFIEKVLEDEGFKVESLPFVDPDTLIAFRTLRYKLSKGTKTFKIHVVAFLKLFEMDSPLHLSQDKALTYPRFRILKFARSGLEKSLSNTISRAFKNAITDIEMASDFEEGEIKDSIQKLLDTSEAVPEETKGIDIYIEIPAIVITKPVTFSARYGKEEDNAGAVLVNTNNKSGEKRSVIIVNYQYLRALIQHLKGEVEKRIGDNV